MFRRTQQCGFLPVFQSFGASPLELWEMKVQNGSIRRVTDEHVRALALELAGTNVSTCYVYCPRDPKASLGINMPYLVMIVKNLKKYFTFEVTILDDSNAHRRFRLSNFQKVIQVQYFNTCLPLCLNPGWNEVYFDLAEFTRKAYKTRYVETTRIKINANCRVRVIYFCDKLYDDKDIPNKLKIFQPSPHKKKECVPEPKPEVPDLGSISQFFYEFEDTGEDYYEPSIASKAVQAQGDEKSDKGDMKTEPSQPSFGPSGIEGGSEGMMSGDEQDKQDEAAADEDTVEPGAAGPEDAPATEATEPAAEEAASAEAPPAAEEAAAAEAPQEEPAEG